MSGDPLAFWRSTSGFEVDFILGDHTAIEVKATENLAPQETRGLAALAEEGRFARYLCVTLERRPRQLGQVTVLPYRQFLERLWSDDFV